MLHAHLALEFITVMCTAGYINEVKRGRNLKLATSLYLDPRCRMRGAFTRVLKPTLRGA